MTSLNHEALVEILRSRPRLAIDLLPAWLRARLQAQIGAPGSSVPLRIADAALTRLTPTEYHADLVIVVGDPPTIAFIVEVQLSRDSAKRDSWAWYTVGLQVRLKCPVVLVVVAVNAAVARWCAKPIRLGHPGLELRPVVVGPHRIPLVAEAEQARACPELLVLSAMAHGKGRSGRRLAHIAAGTLVSLDPERAKLYADLILMHLGEAARRALEAKMMTNYQSQSEFFRNLEEKWRTEGREQGRTEGREQGRTEGREQGRTEGREQGQREARADAVLKVLCARELEVSAETEQRIRAVADINELRALLDRAFTIERAADLFG